MLNKVYLMVTVKSVLELNASAKRSLFIFPKHEAFRSIITLPWMARFSSAFFQGSPYSYTLKSKLSVLPKNTTR